MRTQILTNLTAIVLLPLLLALPILTSPGEHVLQFIVARPSLCWLAVLMMLLAAIPYCRAVSATARFVRAGFDIEEYEARTSDPAARSRRRRRNFRLVAVSLACLLSLAVSEVLLRLFDIRPPEIHPQYVDDQRVDNSRNALGIRESWNEVPGDNDTLRIAFVGDSFTYGEGVEREEAFPHVVEAILNEHLDTNVVTVNCGEPGTDAEAQLDIFTRLRPAIDPHIVVHVPYLNDLSAGMDAAGMLKRIYRIRDEELWAGKFSYLIHFVEKQVRFAIARRRTRAFYKGGDTALARERSWQRFESQIVALKQEVEQGPALYCMALFPCLIDLDDYWLTGTHARMADIAAAQNVMFLDLFEVFKGRDAARLRVNLGNEHPNAQGHQIAARRLATWLIDDIIPAWEADRSASQGQQTP